MISKTPKLVGRASARQWLLGSLLLVFAGNVLADAPTPAKSGYEFVKDETREMQDDEFQNPGFIAVEQGRELFNKTPDKGKSCASCHGEKGEKLDVKNLARYPIYDKEQGGIVRLQDKIMNCREKQSGDRSVTRTSSRFAGTGNLRAPSGFW